ncbi:hypothetical protein PF010_g29047, partial [Phytophthora fragariae]
MADHEGVGARPRVISRSSSSRTAPWTPQVLAVAVVRVCSESQSLSPAISDADDAQTDAMDAVEFARPPLDSETLILNEQQLLRCGRLLAASIDPSVASNGGGWGFALDEEEDEAPAEGSRDEEEEEEIFSREMQAADAGVKDRGVFFCLPRDVDHKYRAVVGVAFVDTRMSTRKSRQKRFLMLLLAPNKGESMAGFGALRAQLGTVARRFFDEGTEDGECVVVDEFYKELEKQQPVLANGLLPNAAMVRRLGGSDVVATLHALLLQGRVVCYSVSASAASAAVVTLLAMLPSQLAHSLLQERRGVFVVQPCCSLECGEEFVAGNGGYLIGTSNPLLLKNEDAQFDLVLDLDAGQVTAHPTATSERAFAFGTKTAALADDLTRRFTDPVAPLHMRIAGQRTRDNDEENDSYSKANSGMVDLFSESFRSMLEEIAAPVLGSLVRVDDEDESPNPRTAFCTDYGWSWSLSWQSTSNYAKWHEQELRQRRLTRSSSKGSFRTPKPPPHEGHARYTYPNGDEYEGDFVEGMREGYGIYLERASGNLYDGSWLADERHGKGVLTSKASGGYIYDGEWVHDMRCGQGHSTRRGGGGTSGGESYTGQWYANHFHGRGVYVNSEGDVYDGEWRDGIRHGAGKLTIVNPVKTRPGEMGGVVRYVGEWADGKFHGVGSCQYADGSEYSGTFQQGRRHGNGILVLASGDRYEGHGGKDCVTGRVLPFPKPQEPLVKYSGACRRGRPWGKGTCKFANGAVYSGDWIDGLREGRGICVNPDGAMLEGEWQHSVFVKAVRSPSQFVDVSLSSNTPPSSPRRPSIAAKSEGETEHPMFGFHRHVYPSGDVYEGEFKEGRRDGFGIFTERSTGITYEGQWVQDLRHGNGVLTSGSKDFIYDGAWENDQRCGYGHCVISGGRETFSGQWCGNAFHGIGKYTDAEGSVYEGEFVRGKKHGVGKLTAPVMELQSESTETHQTEQYSGEWRDGCREGVGDAVFADGSRYSGQWKDDLQDGEGTFTSAEGDR